jgi:hypothetical protein
MNLVDLNYNEIEKLINEISISNDDVRIEQFLRFFEIEKENLMKTCLNYTMKRYVSRKSGKRSDINILEEDKANIIFELRCKNRYY